MAQRITTVVCALLAALATGCGACRATRSPDRGTPEAPRLAKASDLTPAERQWGIGPQRGPDVTYQADVVLLDEGPKAIVGLSPNGLEWTIDGKVAHVDQLRPGKILFATSRAVGRILNVRQDGPHIAVILGPVDLTEIVRDLTVKFDQPIDFGEALAYSVTNLPGVRTPPEPQGTSTSERVFDEPHFALVRAPGASGFVTRVSDDVRQRAFPIISEKGFGLRVTVEGKGTRLTSDATFHLAKPHLNVDVVIADGKVRRAVLELHGAAGVTLGFEASTDRGVSGNFELVEPSLPTDLSIPIFGPAFPMTVNLRQGFYLDTGWGGKGSLSANADFTAEGAYNLGYDGGSWGIHGPTNFKWTVHPLKTVEGVSLGATGLVAAYQMKVIVGVGAWGFATGPFLRLHTSIGISRDSDLVSMRQCRAATILVNLGAGFGYVVPQALVNGINAILRTMNIGTIRSEGGIDLASVKLLDSHTVVPPIASCGAQ